jgi:transcriptional regulator with XRE-family HTH domain
MRTKRDLSPEEREFIAKVAEGLRSHMKDKKMGQSELARLLGISDPALTALLNNPERMISGNVLVKALVDLGIPIPYGGKTVSVLVEDATMLPDRPTQMSLIFDAEMLDVTDPIEKKTFTVERKKTSKTELVVRIKMAS